MKKFINILLAAAVTALAVVSCQKEEQVKPGTPDPEGCYGVYFPVQEASGDHTYDPDMDRSVTITVARTNTSGAITVPYTVVSDDEAVFTFGKIEFADGQDETELEVTFENIEEGKKCAFSVQLNDDNAYVSHYNSGAIAFDFSVMVVKWEYFLNPVTKEKAVVEFSQGWWGETAWCYIKYYEVNGVRTCVTETFNHEYNGEEYDDPGFWGFDNEWTFIWYPEKKNADGYDLIRIPLVNTGYHNSSYDADVYALDYFYWNADDPDDESEFLSYAAKNSDVVSYYDGNGGFYLSIRSYYMFGVGGWNPGAYDTIGIAEGFTRVDYSLTAEADYPDEGVTPVLFTVGADVAKVDYAIYEGSLNSVQVQARVDAIAAGTEENVVSVDEFAYDEYENIYYAYIGVSPETTGEYTLVAVSFNKTTEAITKSEAKESANVSFFHVSADDDADYDVTVSAFTEDTPARYEKLHKYDSFAYGVSGKDLTEVHVAFYTSDIITKYGMNAVVADLKADEDGEYTVSADVLAEINSDGGYYTVATGMKAKTTYYVMVWATNGSKESVTGASYTTDKLPYVWKNLGKGTLTDGLLLPDWSMDDVTVACDVFEDENTPGIYMITGFQLELCSLFYEVDPAELAPYEGEDGNWWNAEIVIDATNPEAVLIEKQQYGIYTNGTYQYAIIWSTVPDTYGAVGGSGTLADGAITFPANGLVIGYTGNGKAYYGNPDGTYKITLPAAEAPATTAMPTATVKKTNFTHADSKVCTMPTVKYEREVKSISVETKTVDYSGRKESQPKSKKALTPVSDYLAK